MDEGEARPAAAPYCSIHNLVDTDDAFTDDNQGKKTHARIKVGVLKTDTRFMTCSIENGECFDGEEEKP